MQGVRTRERFVCATYGVRMWSAYVEYVWRRDATHGALTSVASMTRELAEPLLGPVVPTGVDQQALGRPERGQARWRCRRRGRGWRGGDALGEPDPALAGGCAHPVVLSGAEPVGLVVLGGPRVGREGEEHAFAVPELEERVCRRARGAIMLVASTSVGGSTVSAPATAALRAAGARTVCVASVCGERGEARTGAR